MLGIVLFHLWKEQNQRKMQVKTETKQQVLRRNIEMVRIGFEEGKFKRECKTDKEVRTLLQWDALLMLIHDRDGRG